ncbi:MAG: ATP synthase subunit I [Tepidanaerobacteraceae bacterium]|nr:ATP synthase subunit I [Tepidanaerobacteraceae bacterium]
MESVNRDFGKILRESYYISLAAVLLSLLLDKNGRWALGLAAGTFATNFNFVLLYISLIKSVKSDYRRAFSFMCGMYLFRIAIVMSTLLICLKQGFEAFISSVLGLMVIKLMLFSNTILGRWKRWNSSRR